MPKFPVLSGSDIVKILCHIGYKVARQKGSHIRLHHENRLPTTVPDHKVIGKKLLGKILRDIELSPKDFQKLI